MNILILNAALCAQIESGKPVTGAQLDALAYIDRMRRWLDLLEDDPAAAEAEAKARWLP
jgi:hypothetical protein